MPPGSEDGSTYGSGEDASPAPRYSPNTTSKIELGRRKFEQYQSRKYGTPSPQSSSITSCTSEYSVGTPASESATQNLTLRSTLNNTTPTNDPVQLAGFDITGYTPNTAIHMQSRQIEKLTKHIAELKAAELDLAAAELEEERRRTSDIMKTHVQEIHGLKKSIAATTNEMEAYWQTQVRGMELELKDSNRMCQLKEQTIVEQKTNILSLTDDTRQLQEDLKNSQVDSHNLRQASSEMEGRVREMAQEIATLQQNIRKQAADFDNQLQLQRGKLQRAEDMSTKLTQQLKDSESELAVHQRASLDASNARSQESLVQHIDELENALELKSTTLNEFEGKVAKCLNGQAGQSIDDLIESFTALQTDCEDTTERVSVLQDQVAKLESEASDRAATIMDLEHDKCSVAQQLRECEVRCSELEASVANSQEESARVWGKSQAERKGAHQLQLALNAANSSKSALETQVASLESRHQVSAANLHSIAEDKKILEASMERVEQLNRRLQLDVKTAHEAASECRQQLGTILPSDPFVETTTVELSIDSVCDRLRMTVEQVVAQPISRTEPQLTADSSATTVSDVRLDQHSTAHAESHTVSIQQDRDKLAEQNAFLHMDVANLTTQLIQLLATAQRRDEDVLHLQTEVERMQTELEEEIASRAATAPSTTLAVPEYRILTTADDAPDAALNSTDAVEEVSDAAWGSHAAPHKIRIKRGQIPAPARGATVDQMKQEYEILVKNLMSDKDKAEQNQIDERNANILVQQQLRSALNEMCDKLASQMTAAQSTLTTLRSDNHSLEQTVNSLNSQLRASALEATDLQHQLQNAQSNFKQAQDEVEERIAAETLTFAAKVNLERAQFASAEKDAIERLQVSQDELVAIKSAVNELYSETHGFKNTNTELINDSDSDGSTALLQMSKCEGVGDICWGSQLQSVQNVVRILMERQAVSSQRGISNDSDTEVQELTSSAEQNMVVNEPAQQASPVRQQAPSSIPNAFIESIQQLTKLYEQQKVSGTELNDVLNRVLGKGAGDTRRGLTEAAVNTMNSPPKKRAQWHSTITSLQAKRDAVTEAQNTVTQHLNGINEWIAMNVGVQQTPMAIGNDIENTADNEAFAWWTQMSNSAQKEVLSRAPSGTDLCIFVDSQERWDSALKLRPGPRTPALDPLQVVSAAESEQYEASPDSSSIGLRLHVDLLMKELAGMKQDNASLREQLSKCEVAAACATSPPTGSEGKSTFASPAAKQDPSLPVRGTPNWGSLTPLHNGSLGHVNAIPTLADSVNRELAALHQHAVKINETQGTPAPSPRRVLAELQESILEHISALSACVADTIRNWNAASTSPAGKVAQDQISGLNGQVVGLSAAFQRSLGSTGAGWLNPMAQFIDRPPVGVECPSVRVVGRSESTQRSLEFTDGIQSYCDLESLRPSSSNYSGYAPDCTELTAWGQNGMTESLQRVPAVTGFEMSLAASEISEALEQATQTSPLKGEQKYTFLKEALLKAHRDFKTTAAAEKKIVEHLTNEIERLENNMQSCIQREHAKDEKWSSWVRAIFKLCCDPSNPESAPVEATSAMMMAVEQFVLGHHDEVRAYETKALQYEKDLEGLIGQKRFLLRTMQLYEGIQHGAMRTITELGCSSRRREPIWNRSPRTRLRVAVFVVLACIKCR